MGKPPTVRIYKYMKRQLIIAAVLFLFATLGSAGAQSFSAPQFTAPQWSPPQFASPQFTPPHFAPPQFSPGQFTQVNVVGVQFNVPQPTLPVRPVVQRFQTPQFQVTSGVRPSTQPSTRR